MANPRGIPPTPEYRWNEAAKRYIASNGRFVKQSDVRQSLERVIGGAQRDIDALSKALVDGDISLAQWQLGMERNIKALHTASTAAARGGWAQMSQADWGYTGSIVKEQYRFLQNFAEEIANGNQPLNGNLMRRARMYGDASRGSMESMRRRIFNSSGFTEERRVLGQADHCPDCVRYAAKGWQPMGTLPKIGESVCRTNCRCHFEYRNANGDVSE